MSSKYCGAHLTAFTGEMCPWCDIATREQPTRALGAHGERQGVSAPHAD